MSLPRALLTSGFCLALLAGCADHRVDRNDDEAMMVYRECMASSPPQLNSSNMSSTISNSAMANKNTSIAANAQTQQEESQRIRCMQLAGWAQ